MAITRISGQVAGTGTGDSTPSLGITVPTGTDTLVVSIHYRANAAPTAVSLDGDAGVSMILQGHNTVLHTSMWYILAPTIGAGTLEVTLGGTGRYAVYCTYFSGVDQTTVHRTGSSSSSSTNNPTTGANVTSAVGDLLIDAISTRTTTASSVAPQDSQNEEYEGTNSTLIYAGGTVAGSATSTDMDWTLNVADNWAWAGVALIPAPSGVTVISPSANTTFSAPSPTARHTVITTAALGTFSAASPVVRHRLVSPPASTTFNAASPVPRTTVVSPPGNTTFSGLAPTITGPVLSIPTGNATFSAPASEVVIDVAVSVPTGSVTFSAEAPQIRNILAATVGSVTMSAAAPVPRTSVAVPVGQATFNGASPILAHFVVVPTADSVFDADPPTVMHILTPPPASATFSAVEPGIQGPAVLLEVPSAEALFSAPSPTLIGLAEENDANPSWFLLTRRRRRI